MFSIAQMMMQLSALSRTTSISNSFQPRTDSSTRTSTDGRGIKTAHGDIEKFFAVIRDAAAQSAQREGGADDRGQAHKLESLFGILAIVDLHRTRRFQPDLAHGFAELQAILGLVDHIGLGADHLDPRRSRVPSRARVRQVFSAVWPPMVGRIASGRSASRILVTISGVIGSI